jgi:hypothetical protein
MTEWVATKGIAKLRGVACAAAMLGLFAAGEGCADHVQSAVLACPCDQGICCASGVCAADQSSCEQATQALSSESAGHWTGYVENFAFPSGADALDLTLNVETDGSLSGRMIFGAGTVPAPPTDGTVAWPPNLNLNFILMEGVAYHVTNVKWTARRLQFQVAEREPWGPWCQLQEPHMWAPGWWECGPNAGFGPGGQGGCALDYPSGPVSVDCDWLHLCVQLYPEETCACSESGCDASPQTSVALDIALRGNDGDGSIGGVTNAQNVRLIRASN